MRQAASIWNTSGILRLAIAGLAILAISLGMTAGAGTSAAGDDSLPLPTEQAGQEEPGHGPGPAFGAEDAVEGSAGEGDRGDGDKVPSIPEKRELKYPNLGSRLNDMAVLAEEGEASAQEAAEGATAQREGLVAVTVYLSGNVADVVDFLEDNGGDPRNVGEDYIEAYVPVSVLGDLSEQPGVLRVREIVPPQPDQAGPTTGQGPSVHSSLTWNQAGLSGQGVKVGVIDGFFGFNDFRELMGTELPSTVQARCYTEVGRFTRNIADCENDVFGSDHGTIVAETVIDIAPEVDLYIASPVSLGDTIEVVDWMVAEGVSVIVRSESYIFDGPGDGTSPFSNSPLNTIDRAVDGGVTWVNAAGNAAERTWFGGYSDADLDGWIEFNEFDETIALRLEAGDLIQVQLRWEGAWSDAASDFDLYLVDEFRTLLAFSVNPQSGGSGHVPSEYLEYVIPWDGEYHVAVAYYSGSVPGWLQVMVSGVESIQHYTQNGSITNPSESANPGMLAVGAAPLYNVQAIETYSSRGPTPDGRVKPDVVGATCGATALTPLDDDGEGFCGTSQAAPHVAGLAALVRQRFPDYTPAQIASYLKSNAAQREAPDPNNTWGHGFALLPALPRGCAEFVPGLESDCDTLLGMRDSLMGSGSLNWAPYRSIAEWEGVTVAGAPQRVTELSLTGKGLTGEIPAALGDLSSLTVLSLSDNQLTGDIPAALGSLVNLEGLFLWGNQLTGDIPAALGDLSSLTVLSLSDNQLTGEVPQGLTDMTALEYFGFYSNQGLCAPLDDAFQVWLQSIPIVHGSSCALADSPEDRSVLVELYRATDGDNWENVDNWLRDRPIREWRGVTNDADGRVTGLYLFSNQLTGEIPTELGDLANLETLSLWGNELTGEIPTGLGNLSNLTVLSLSQNQLTGRIPTELGDLANLETLSLGDNELTGEIPTGLGNLSNLTVLSLSSNQLTGEIPAELGDLANLEELYLWDNQLTGEIPIGLGNLSNLTVLSLSSNQLTGEIPAELGDLANLEELYLWDNQLTGEIPIGLGNLSNLTVLSLSSNQLTGEIPAELGDLANLEELYLWDNQLTGEIPIGLGNLSNLTVLSLSRNQLSGRIPTELGDLANLETLSLWDNELTGQIPAALGGLSSLDELYLSQNGLTGCIPKGLQRVTNNDFSELGLPFCVVEFPAQETGERSVAEDTGAGMPIGDPVQATSSGATLTYTLGGTDVASFGIDSGTGQTRTSAALDYETRAIYEVTVTATDSDGESNSIDVTITVRDVDEAPVLSGSAAVNHAENGTAVATYTATDPEGASLIWSLSGDDAGDFSITGGALAFKTAPDFETEADADTDNVYEVTVEVSDGTNSDSMDVAITVTDEDEAPVLTGNANISYPTGGTDSVATYTATDPEGASLTWSLSGDDAGDFSIMGGVLAFMTTPDADAPTDADTDNVYDVTVTVTDSSRESATIDVTITVTDVNQAPAFPDSEDGTRSVAENMAAGVNIGAAVRASDPDGDALTYTLGVTGAASFDIDPDSGQLFVKAPLDYETKDEYSVTVTATDPSGESATRAVTITVIDVDEAPTLRSNSGLDGFDYPENRTGPVEAFIAIDPEGASLTWSLSGDDAADFTITGGELAFAATPDVDAPADADTDNVYEVIVEVSDGTNEATVTVTVTVTEEAPQTLLERYDTNGNGSIEKSEVIVAINDYLFGTGADAISKNDVIEVINLYLFG